MRINPFARNAPAPGLPLPVVAGRAAPGIAAPANAGAVTRTKLDSFASVPGMGELVIPAINKRQVTRADRRNAAWAQIDTSVPGFIAMAFAIPAALEHDTAPRILNTVSGVFFGFVIVGALMSVRLGLPLSFSPRPVGNSPQARAQKSYATAMTVASALGVGALVTGIYGSTVHDHQMVGGLFGASAGLTVGLVAASAYAIHCADYT